MANTPEVPILQQEMARKLLLVVLAATVAAPIAMSASSSATDGTLSVKGGRGLTVLKLKGTVIGRLNYGRVRIVDKTPFDDQAPQFRHCRILRYVNVATTVCTGRKLSFRALDGRYVVRVQGRGMYLSAVGHGTVMVDGAGDQGVPDGVMSIDDGPYQSLPDFATIFDLGTSAARR
jgi:hypothetical protein